MSLHLSYLSGSKASPPQVPYYQTALLLSFHCHKINVSHFSSYNFALFLLIPFWHLNLCSKHSGVRGTGHFEKCVGTLCVPHLCPCRPRGLAEQCTQPSGHYPFDLGSWQSNRTIQVANPELYLNLLGSFLAGLPPGILGISGWGK